MRLLTHGSACSCTVLLLAPASAAASKAVQSCLHAGLVERGLLVRQT